MCFIKGKGKKGTVIKELSSVGCNDRGGIFMSRASIETFATIFQKNMMRKILEEIGIKRLNDIHKCKP